MNNQAPPRFQAADPSDEKSKRSTVLAALVVMAAVSSTGAAAGSSQPPQQSTQRGTASYAKLPLHFEPNHGQTDEQVKFLARGSGYGLFLTSTELVLSLRKTVAGRQGTGLARGEAPTPKRSSSPEVLRMKLLGADSRPAVEGREELPGKSHYFIGNDSKKWRTDVPQYARVEYRDVYPGVSLTYYGNQGQLEYDFVVSPGGDPRRIRLGIAGAQKIHVDAEGNLVLRLRAGEVVEKAPVVYQEVGGVRKAVEGRFVMKGRGEVGFEVGAYEADRPLVLDPVLVYSTYLGGLDLDAALGIDVDATGNTYVTGTTASTNFPTASPLQAANGGVQDVFVAKLSASGSAIVYSTYLGGSGDEGSLGIAVDPTGSASVTGVTDSTNFPTANPLQAGYGGNPNDAFVAKLSVSGSALVYSTYLGGGGDDQGRGIAVDLFGNAYVSGSTFSQDFPTANALQGGYGGGTSDAFVAKVNSAGSAFVFSTYLGGSSTDWGENIALDPSGNAYVTGYTFSTDFPTVNPLQPANGGSGDVFLAKLNAAGSALVYSTYLGGSGFESGGVAVDAQGNAYVTGLTASTNFPTASPIQAAYGGGTYDAFVTKVNAPGSALVYSTYLGGLGDDRGAWIAADASGKAHVTGSTGSVNFPTANPLQAMNGGGNDVFVTKVNAAGSAFVYSTYLGGLGDDQGYGIAADASGNAHVTGSTDSLDFPTANPLQAANGGNRDAFVAKIAIASSFFSVTPCRVADTRDPVGPSGGPALGANTIRTFPVTGVCGIPSTASAIALILTVVGETDFGDLRLYPAGSPAPTSSAINFGVQKVRANNAIVTLGLGGQIAVQCDMPTASTGQTHFLFDVTGYFQ